MVQVAREGGGLGRLGRSPGPAGRCTAATLLVIALLLSFRSVSASVETTSGTVALSNILNYGTTGYTVDYAYPSVTQVGTNLTISLTLIVDSQTGLVDYTTAYNLLVDVYVGNEPALKGSVNSSLNAPFLYQGARWGPNNVTIPLTAANTGLKKGESANATVSVTLQSAVYYSLPVETSETQPAMEGQAGTLVVQNGVPSGASAAGNGYYTVALVSSGVILVLIAVVMPRGPRPSRV